MAVTKDIPTAESVKGGVETYRKSLGYMDFHEGDSMIGKQIDFVFLNSYPHRTFPFAGSGPVPVQSFHSLTDPTVPYEGNADWVGQAEMDSMVTRHACVQNVIYFLLFPPFLSFDLFDFYKISI